VADALLSVGTDLFVIGVVVLGAAAYFAGRGGI
jgi:hypothetical protein